MSDYTKTTAAFSKDYLDETPADGTMDINETPEWFTKIVSGVKNFFLKPVDETAETETETPKNLRSAPKITRTTGGGGKAVPVKDALLENVTLETLYAASFNAEQINECLTNAMRDGTVVRVCLQGASTEVEGHTRRMANYLTTENPHNGVQYKTAEVYRDHKNRDFYFCPKYFAIDGGSHFEDGEEPLISVRTLDYGNVAGISEERANKTIHEAIWKGEVIELIVNPPDNEEARKIYQLVDGIIHHAKNIGRPCQNPQVYISPPDDTYGEHAFNLYIAPDSYCFRNYETVIVKRSSQTTRYAASF